MPRRNEYLKFNPTEGKGNTGEFPASKKKTWNYHSRRRAIHLVLLITMVIDGELYIRDCTLS